MFTIKFAGSRKSETHESLDSAKASLVATWPNAFFWEGEERALVWENEARSENDDGYAAVASIHEEQGWSPYRTADYDH